MGTNGLHVYVYDDRHRLNQADARGHFGIVHELGHYVFALYDEYIDQHNNPASCINATSQVASIMDGGTTVQPQNRRTNWSLPQDQATCERTAQFQKGNMVSWPWIITYTQQTYAAALTQPADYIAAAPAGHQALTFNYYDCKVRAVVCIDQSGSMGYENKLGAAKQGGKLFVDLTQPGDELGVTAYSDSASTIYAMAVMTATTKAAAKSAIDGLGSTGSTNIGGGLQQSLGLITGQGKAVSNEVIILLSDGQHNTGTHPSNVIPALKARGVTVYTIGLGSDADAALMSEIASSTGGSYYFSPTGAGLSALYNSIFAQMRNDGMITKLNGTMASGEQTKQRIRIDDYTQAGGAATFILSWSDGTLDLGLRRPNGTSVADNDPDVISHVSEPNNEIYVMRNPAKGNWDADVRAVVVPGTFVNYDLQVNSPASSGVAVQAMTKKSHYDRYEPIVVQVSVHAPASGTSDGGPVAGANVDVDVSVDGKVVDNMSLFDDGNPASGDAKANDGIYTGTFTPSPYTGKGSYTFDATVNNTNGVLAPPDEQWDGFPVWNGAAVAPFVRRASVTVGVDPGPRPPDA